VFPQFERNVSLGVTKALGVNYFLERREIGIINIGADGAVIVRWQGTHREKKRMLICGLWAQKRSHLRAAE